MKDGLEDGQISAIQTKQCPAKLFACGMLKLQLHQPSRFSTQMSRLAFSPGLNSWRVVLTPQQSWHWGANVNGA